MERLTTINGEGIGVLKQPFECERCGDVQWSLPDLGQGSPIDRLAEYEDLEEQGLLLKLPCKVGDTVYELQKIRHRIQPLEIISVYIGRMGELYFYWELKDGVGIYQNVKGFGISQLGKTVFLTQVEAELALEEMKKIS